MIESPVIHWLSTSPPKGELHTEHRATLLESPQQRAGILVIDLPTVQQDKVLLQLHRSGGYWAWQVYTVESSPLSDALSDGLWSEQDWQTRWDYHQQRLALIHEGEDDKMMAWLWLNPSRRLLPHYVRDSLSIYQYPLLSAYMGESDSPYGFLVQEVKNERLEEDELLDKIRLCSHCHSGHVNYLETCPSCHSADITEKVSLHCFTCGHVDLQSHFTRKGKIECPNCLTKLRHIGVDYDRPLEVYECRQCGHNFVEAETKARCMECHSLQDIHQLIARNIFTYKAGEQTNQMMRHGHVLTIPELSLKGRVERHYFSQLLVWLNTLARRHDQAHLLIGLYFPGLKEYGYHFGELKLFQLIDQITERFNGLLRDTDLCCQYHNDMMFLLMPMTEMANMHVLQGKIEQIADLIEDEEFTMLVSAWALPNEECGHDVVNWLESCAGELQDV
ncbi:diguanylate cyclase [Thaumasiovibrio subtropicus]|uniref:TackOD1 domain-containing metal-binding protein n=1 Tax=Thaumasiovibrio subtropicus TaxID=1891207 RepID=UPI000B35979F|nr:diguanylate cyclase [Thaumasiovibrio subtropicus]